MKSNNAKKLQSKVITDELHLSVKYTSPAWGSHLQTQETLVVTARIFTIALGVRAIFLLLKSERTSGVEVRGQGWE